MIRFVPHLLAAGILFPPVWAAASAGPIAVGSKHFNEAYILAEIISRLLEDRGYPVERRFGLGGTMVCYESLRNGEIDVYPEYSGTLQQAVLKLEGTLEFSELAELLDRDHGLQLLEPFGFDNTYVLAVRRGTAERLNLKAISDLLPHPDLRFGFSHEFLNRRDGWLGLAPFYGFRRRPVGIEHGLAYQAVAEGKVDVMDAYSTDAKIDTFGMTLLEDDRGFFPAYLAAPILRAGLDPRIGRVLSGLAGTIDETAMRRMNAAVVVGGDGFAAVADRFLEDRGLLTRSERRGPSGRWAVLGSRTVTHVQLTLAAVLAALVVAVPSGILIYRMPALSRPVLYLAGLLQTIPSIALLAFMIPLFGIGAWPAIIALFLYALLPILRNTHAALESIDPVLKKIAVGMGLSVRQRLRHVEIPLAMPTILAGLRTATVINIGTATLAAFIGAGGLGEPIVTGLALNDSSLILEGAIPAALLAVLAELLFEGLERLLVPRHLARATRR